MKQKEVLLSPREEEMMDKEDEGGNVEQESRFMLMDSRKRPGKC